MKKTESYLFYLGNGISRGWEQKSTTGRFATGWFWLTKGLLCSNDTQNNTRLLAVMELLFSRSTRYQEIITVYIILLDTLFVRCFHTWDSVLNTRREIPYQHAPMYYSLCGRVKKMAEFVLKPQCKIPEKLPYSTNFNSVARSLSDRFSFSPAIIDCWPQKRLLMNVKPWNLLINAPAKIAKG